MNRPTFLLDRRPFRSNWRNFVARIMSLPIRIAASNVENLGLHFELSSAYCNIERSPCELSHQGLYSLRDRKWCQTYDEQLQICPVAFALGPHISSAFLYS